MSADAETDPRGLSAIVDGDPATGPATASPPGAAGRLLGRLSVLPALLTMAWLVAGLPLLLAGRFTPVLMLVVSVPLAVLLIYLGLRWIPDRWPGTLPVRGPEQARTPWWAVAGVLVVAAAFGLHQMIYHSQQIIIRLDPASYIQFGAWIAHHGSLPIPQARAAFGGTHNLLYFGSAAFYQVGHSIVPQFMAGLPMVLAAGFWIGGVGAAIAMGPVLGACAVLTFGGLAARLAGPRWAPLAALVLAISLPEQFTSRSNYSEPLAQILFLGGLCLAIDSLQADGAGARALAALGGLALGLTLLVRIDGISDILPVIPYCGLLLLGRRPQAVPLLAGLSAGALYSVLDGLVLSRPYLDSIRSSLKPLLALVAVVVVLTAVAVVVFWDRGLPRVRAKWLPTAAAVLPFVVLAGLAIRPYLQPVRHVHLTGTQRAAGVLLNPQSVFFALSLHWVFWYIGLPAVLLGTLGAALLARRCAQGRAAAWTLPLLVFAWIIVTVLLRPAIVPNHPWASRRLVPAVLPGFIVMAVWTCGWLTGWLRQHGYDRVLQAGLASACAVALVVPGAMTTFGLGVRDGLGFTTTYSGEIAAVDHMCAAIPRDSAVVIVTGETVTRLAQVVRGMCGEPTAGLYPRPGTVGQVVRGIRQAGRQPVLLAAHCSQLTRYGGVTREIMNLRTRQDTRIRTAPPLRTRRFTVTVCMSEPAP